eukprot:s1173_g5.t1
MTGEPQEHREREPEEEPEVQGYIFESTDPMAAAAECVDEPAEDEAEEDRQTRDDRLRREATSLAHLTLHAKKNPYCPHCQRDPFFTPAPIIEDERDTEEGKKKGKTLWEVATDKPFDGISYPLGALALYRSKGGGMAEPTTRPGLFAGWHLAPGLRYKGNVKVLDYEAVRGRPHLHWEPHVLHEKEIYFPPTEYIEFPLALAAHTAMLQMTDEEKEAKKAIYDGSFVEGVLPYDVCVDSFPVDSPPPPPRHAYITWARLMKHGFTKGCAGCLWDTIVTLQNAKHGSMRFSPDEVNLLDRLQNQFMMAKKLSMNLLLLLTSFQVMKCQKAHQGLMMKMNCNQQQSPDSCLGAGVLYRGDQARNEKGNLALYQTMSASPASITAANAIILYGLMCGHKISSADAIKAYLQSLLNSLAETWARLPREVWPASWFVVKTDDRCSSDRSLGCVAVYTVTQRLVLTGA